MKNNNSLPAGFGSRFVAKAAPLALAALLGACAGDPPAAVAPVAAAVAPVPADDSGLVSALAYYQNLQRMSPAQLSRERSMLAALPPSPGIQLRMAMLLGHPRSQADLGKAMSLLDPVLKSSDPVAVGLQPLARLLADNFGERLKLETQLEKQGQQLKESQRKAAELQEKIDSLADIERTLPQRPRATRQSGATR